MANSALQMPNAEFSAWASLTPPTISPPCLAVIRTNAHHLWAGGEPGLNSESMEGSGRGLWTLLTSRHHHL